MRVKATATGFHGGFRRRSGDVFEVPDGSRSKWFVPADDAKADDKPRGRGKKAAPETLSEITKTDSEAMGGDAQA